LEPGITVLYLLGAVSAILSTFYPLHLFGQPWWASIVLLAEGIFCFVAASLLAGAWPFHKKKEDSGYPEIRQE
jgi:hypothetical protein